MPPPRIPIPRMVTSMARFANNPSTGTMTCFSKRHWQKLLLKDLQEQKKVVVCVGTVKQGKQVAGMCQKHGCTFKLHSTRGV